MEHMPVNSVSVADIGSPLLDLREAFPRFIESKYSVAMNFAKAFKAYRVGWTDAAGVRHCLRCVRIANKLFSTDAAFRDLLARIAEADRDHLESLANVADSEPAERKRLKPGRKPLKARTVRTSAALEAEARKLGLKR